MLSQDLKVITSFRYSEAGHLMHAKYYTNGNLIIKALSNFALSHFTKTDSFKKLYKLNELSKIAVVYIGEYKLKNFSHSAIIARSFKKYNFKVVYNAITPQNNLKYSSLSLQERQIANRNFLINLDKKYKFVILVDDICTTGQTLLEANAMLKKQGVKVLFAFCLIDSRL